MFFSFDIIKNNQNRYEFKDIPDPGFIKKGKQLSGINGFEGGCIKSIIGFVLTHIFNKTLSWKSGSKTYYFYRSSISHMVGRITPNLTIGSSDLNIILSEVKLNLYEKTLKLNQEAKQQYNNLLVALSKKDVETCKQLLDNGAYAKMPPQRQVSLFNTSIRGGLIELYPLLVTQGADVNERDSTGQTPLEAAIRAYNEEAVNWLLDNGADKTAATASGSSLLELAEKLAAQDDTDPAFTAQKRLAIIEMIK